MPGPGAPSSEHRNLAREYMSLHLRFTHPDEDSLGKLINWLKSMAPESVITCLEPADNEVSRTHTHSIMKLNIDKIRFTRRFHKIFPMCKGNAFFQVQTEIDDFEAFERYVCKGRDSNYTSVNPTIVYTSYPEEHIKQRHKEYWEVNAQLQSNKKTKKVSIKSWTQDCLAEFKNENPTKVVTRDSQDLYFVYDFVLTKLGNKAKAFDEIVIKRLSLGVYNALIHPAYRPGFRQRLFQKSFQEEFEELCRIPGMMEE